MKIRGTDFVMYQVSDLARAAAFYRDTLGLPQELYSEEWHWAEFNCGNVTLSLHGGLKLPEVISGGRLALAVDDVFAACAELKSKGVRVLVEPTDYSFCLPPIAEEPRLHRRGRAHARAVHRRQPCRSDGGAAPGIISSSAVNPTNQPKLIP